MTSQIAPTPVFRGTDAFGLPLYLGQLGTFVAGTNMPQVTYKDSAGVATNTNPVILNARGECNLWLDPAKAYKLVLSDALGNQIWSVDNVTIGNANPSFNLIPTVDNLFTLGSPSFSWANVYIGPNHAPVLDSISGNIGYYARTSAEIAAGVTPVNFSYPPLWVDRYGTNATPGTTSMATAWQAAINVAKKNGGTVGFGPGPYLIDAPLDLTFPVGSQNCSFAIIGQGRFKAATFTQGIPATPSLIFKHTGHAFDTTGSLGVHFENLSITTDTTTYPQTCFLLARSTDGLSRSDRITNCYVAGYFHQTVLYNYGAEDGLYSGCQLYNYGPDTNSSVFDITVNNARSITSTFTTIASGAQSCIDHKIFGGEFANIYTGAGTNCDVFRIEGARFIKIYGPWLDCTAKNGSSAGRALFYIDGSVTAQTALLLSGVLGEASGATSANYGILVSNNARVHSSWLIEGCAFPNSVAFLGGGTGATISGLTWINNTNESLGGVISFSGAFTNSFFDNSTGTIVAASFDKFNNTFQGGSTLQSNGEVDLNFRDYSQAFGSTWKSIRNQSGSLVISACDNSGNVTANHVQYNTDGTTQSLGKFYPVRDTGAAQTTSGLYAGSGVPSNSNGNNGDFYFRGDTPGTANQRLYIKSAGAWVGIV